MPNYVSVDGQNLPVMFLKAILPWMLQSPLMPNIAILMASYSERLERGLVTKQYSETLSIKSYVLGLVNTFLEQDFKLISDEAIRAVTHLVILEVNSYHFKFGTFIKKIKRLMLDSGGGVVNRAYGHI